MLVVSNVSWKRKKLSDVPKLLEVMNGRMKLYNLKVKTEHTLDGNIIFHNMDDGKTFQSNIENKIFMSEGDKRIKATGREHLISHRPTKKQYDGFFKSILGTLDDVGVGADVTLVVKKQSYILRKDKENYKIIPQPDSFPLEMTAVKGSI